MPGICDTPLGKTLTYCQAPQIVDQAAGTVVGGAFEHLVSEIAKAANALIKTAFTYFLKTPAPDLQSGVVPWIQGHTSYLVGALAVVMVLIAAGRLALERRAEPAAELGKALMRVVLVSAAGVFVTTTLLQAGDLWSDWILQQAGGPITLQNIILIAPAAPYMTSGLAMILGLVVLLGGLLQMVIMIIRGAMIVLLAGTLPLTAAASTTSTGMQMFQKSVGWLTAFVLYKPVAALVYAAAFQMMSVKDDLLTKITGVTLLVMAVLALPALMKFIVPVTAQLGSANGMTGAIAGAGAVAGTVATGAVLVATGGASGFAGAGTAGAMPTGNAAAAGGSSLGGGPQAALTSGTSSAGSATGGGSAGGDTGGGGGGGGSPASGAVSSAVSGIAQAGHGAQGAANRVAGNENGES